MICCRAAKVTDRLRARRKLCRSVHSKLAPCLSTLRNLMLHSCLPCSTPADKKTKGLKRSRRSLATPSKVRPSSSEDRDEGEPSTSKKAAQSTPTPQKTSGVKQQTPKQQRRQQQEQQEQQVQTPLTKHATPKKAVSSSKQGRAAQEASLSGAEGSKKSSSGRVGLQSERKALQQAPQHKEKKKQRMSL